METPSRDASLDHLLDLDGVVMVVDATGRHWVRFVVRRVQTSAEQPHGLSYSLTLHGQNGERLVGFDNAHPIRSTAGPSRARAQAPGHRHRLRTVRPYDHTDAATLLADFWAEVDAVLAERGVLR